MKSATHDPIAIALAEDIGEGDVTTRFFVPEQLRAQGRIVTREKAVVAGTSVAAEVFRRVDSEIKANVLQKDGSEVAAGDVIMELQGRARSILTAERVALNFLQRLCGIATLTREFVQAAANPARQNHRYAENNARAARLSKRRPSSPAAEAIIGSDCSTWSW